MQCAMPPEWQCLVCICKPCQCELHKVGSKSSTCTHELGVLFLATREGTRRDAALEFEITEAKKSNGQRKERRKRMKARARKKSLERRINEEVAFIEAKNANRQEEEKWSREDDPLR